VDGSSSTNTSVVAGAVGRMIIIIPSQRTIFSVFSRGDRDFHNLIAVVAIIPQTNLMLMFREVIEIIETGNVLRLFGRQIRVTICAARVEGSRRARWISSARVRMCRFTAKRLSETEEDTHREMSVDERRREDSEEVCEGVVQRAGRSDKAC
jgi:hypothetical protein